MSTNIPFQYNSFNEAFNQIKENRFSLKFNDFIIKLLNEIKKKPAWIEFHNLIRIRYNHNPDYDYIYQICQVTILILNKKSASSLIERLIPISYNESSIISRLIQELKIIICIYAPTNWITYIHYLLQLELIAPNVSILMCSEFTDWIGVGVGTLIDFKQAVMIANIQLNLIQSSLDWFPKSILIPVTNMTISIPKNVLDRLSNPFIITHEMINELVKEFDESQFDESQFDNFKFDDSLFDGIPVDWETIQPTFDFNGPIIL